jgi:hypothetical protein
MAHLYGNAPRFVAEEADGTRVSGGLLTVFDAGTTTAVQTYSDSAMTVPHNLNDIVSDSDGVFPEIYVSPGSYKIDITDPLGTSLPGYPVDNLALLSQGSLATLSLPAGQGVYTTSPGVYNGFDLNSIGRTFLGLSTIAAQRQALGLLDLTDTAGTEPAYTATPSPALTALATGVRMQIRFHTAPTGSATLDVSGLGAKKLMLQDGTSQLGASRAVANLVQVVEYDAAADGGSGAWIVCGPSPLSDATWEALSSTALAFLSPAQLSGVIGQISTFSHQETSGTNEGFSSTSWATRTINTTGHTGITGASLSSNQITLPDGTYEIVASAPGYNCVGHQIRLYNATDAAVVLVGTSEESDGSSADTQARSFIDDVFTVSSGPKAYEIQHRANSAVATGWGRAAGFGINERYTTVKLRKIA